MLYRKKAVLRFLPILRIILILMRKQKLNSDVSLLL